MMINYLYVLLVTICSFAIVNSQSTIGFGGATSVSGGVLRSYIYSQSIIGNPSFSLVGVSVGGSLLNDQKSGSVSVDTSIFKLDTKFFPTYFFNFFDFDAEVNQGNFSASGTSISSIFMPTFIVEYEETNGQEGFQYGGDTILGYVNLEKLNYKITKQDKAFTNSQSKQFKAYQITLSSDNDLFQMVFYVSENSLSLGQDIELTAEQSKIDILINKYYDATANPRSCSVANSSVISSSCKSTGASSNANSRIALTSFYATLDFAIDLNAEGSIAIEGTDLSAGFSWVSTAQVSTSTDNNVNVKIIADTSATDSTGTVFGSASVGVALSGKVSHQFLVHSFDSVRPNAILWDPSIGASGAADSSSSTVTCSVVFILFSVILSLLF